MVSSAFPLPRNVEVWHIQASVRQRPPAADDKR